MLNPRTRYGLSAVVCVSATLVAFVGTASRYNPTLEGGRIKVLAAELSREIGLPVRGGIQARGEKLVLALRYTPADDRYLNPGDSLMDMKNLMELAAIRFTGFADEVEITATPAGSVLLMGDVPEQRRLSQTVAELRRRFDRKQILESGNRLWPKAAAVPYRPWRCIVLHHSGGPSGSAEAFDRWHREGRKWEGGLGYHFVIGNGNGSGDGQIEAGSRWTSQAVGAHAASPGNQYNEQGVGICLVGNFSSAAELARPKADAGTGAAPAGARLPTGRQIDSLRFLMLYLCLKLGLTPEDMIGHRDVPKAHTLCPGGNFPLESFRRELRRDFERLRRAEE